MIIYRRTLLRPTGFEIVDVNSSSELIDTLKKITGGDSFTLKHIPSYLMSRIKNNYSMGEELEDLLDELRFTERDIVGYAGDYSARNPERDVRISSERAKIKGTFCVSEDSTCITFNPLKRFDKEPDSYKYIGAYDYYTDISMQEILMPILNNAKVFRKCTTKGNIEFISKSEMETILNRFCKREIDYEER